MPTAQDLVLADDIMADPRVIHATRNEAEIDDGKVR
jgi:hypothetical protein